MPHSAFDWECWQGASNKNGKKVKACGPGLGFQTRTPRDLHGRTAQVLLAKWLISEMMNNARKM
jgi:hypothetical protein